MHRRKSMNIDLHDRATNARSLIAEGHALRQFTGREATTRIDAAFAKFGAYSRSVEVSRLIHQT